MFILYIAIARGEYVYSSTENYGVERAVREVLDGHSSEFPEQGDQRNQAPFNLVVEQIECSSEEELRLAMKSASIVHNAMFDSNEEDGDIATEVFIFTHNDLFPVPNRTPI